MNNRALFVSIIKVAMQKNKLHCTVPLTYVNFQVLSILLREGYLYAIHIDDTIKKPKIHVKFKYLHNKSVLKHIQLLSKPGKKIYISFKKLRHHLMSAKNRKLVLSTSNGVISSDQALNEKVGGELLLEYY